MSCSPEPKGKTVKRIPLENRNTGFGTHSLRSTNMTQTWQDAMHTDSYQLWHNQHIYGTEASQATRDITWGCTHHHLWSKWRSDATCEGEPEDVDHSPVCGLSCTGWWIGRASHANARIRSSSWITIVPKKESGHRLGSLSIDFPATTKRVCSGGNQTDDYGSGIEGVGSRIQRCQRPASGAKSRYTDTPSNPIRQSSILRWCHRSICPTDWGMHRAAGSDFGRHHPEFTRKYSPKRWMWWAGSSGGSCGTRAAPRRHLNDCYQLAETWREWLDSRG